MQHIVRNCLYNPTFEIDLCDRPEDLSNATIKFILKSSRTDDDNKALLSGEYVNSDTNIVQFEFTADKTAQLPVGKAIGALKIYREDNRNIEIWSDEYTIEGGVFND